MPEPVDITVPLLQRLQGDLAEFRGEMRGEMRRIGERLEQNAEKLETIETHLTFGLGLIVQSAADVEALQNEMKDIKRRLEVLEGAR